LDDGPHCQRAPLAEGGSLELRQSFAKLVCKSVVGRLDEDGTERQRQLHG
jgi:hypothetical protein